MFQRFTSEEVEKLKLLRPNAREVALQLAELETIARQARATQTSEDLATVRETLLKFRAQLGPDDDTYEVVVDPEVDNRGTNLLCYCNLRLAGHSDHAERFFPSLKG